MLPALKEPCSTQPITNVLPRVVFLVLVVLVAFLLPLQQPLLQQVLELLLLPLQQLLSQDAAHVQSEARFLQPIVQASIGVTQEITPRARREHCSMLQAKSATILAMLNAYAETMLFPFPLLRQHLPPQSPLQPQLLLLIHRIIVAHVQQDMAS